MLNILRAPFQLFAILVVAGIACSAWASPQDRQSTADADGPMRLAQFQVLDGDEEGRSETDSGADGEVAVDGAQGAADNSQTTESAPDEPLATHSEVENEFTWRAQKSGGEIVFTGVLPNENVRALLVTTTRGVVDETRIGENAPDHFLLDALAGLKILAMLEGGTVNFDGETWSVTGASARAASELLEALGGAATPAKAWTFEIASAQPDDDNSSEGVADSAFQRSPGDEDRDADDEVIDTSGGPGDAGEEGAQASPAEAAESTPISTQERDEGVSDPAGSPGDDGSAVQTAQPSSPDPDYRFSALKAADGTLTLQGNVPDPATRALVARLAGAGGQGGLSVNPASPQDFVSALYAGLGALDRLDQGQLAFANGQWLLTGGARIDTQERAALEVLARLGGDAVFKTMITAPPAATVCENALAAFLADKAFLFGSGSTRLTADSSALLPGVARILNMCPQATVYVEGHTDSDGGQALNLPLSVARAETVVDALVDLGIAPARLYAVGYGASLPIASNDTASGKRQNRRIVFNFEDPAQ